MKQQALHAEDIEHISVCCSHMTYVHTAWPYKPAGVTAAQMNLFYGLAVIALHRDGSVRQYDQQRLADPMVLRFIDRISASEDQELEAMGPPFRHACRLTLTTRDGRTFSHERLARRGSPEHAVGEAEIVRKYAANVCTSMSGEDADSLRRLVMRLDEVADTTDLTSLLRTQP